MGNNLVAGSGSLARDDGRPGKEDLPGAEPLFAIGGSDRLLVRHPVQVPAVDSGRVMDSDGVDVLDLETSALELLDDPVQGHGGISTGEDVLGHEETPDEVLVLPSSTETGNLEVKETVIVEHILNLEQELVELADSDVLSHLETGDLVPLLAGDITVIHTLDAGLMGGDAVLLDAVVSEGGLVQAEGDTSRVRSVVLSSIGGEGTPTASDIEMTLALLELDLLADELQLVVLHLFESLLLCDVTHNTGGVDHAGSKEGSVEVIASVVVVADLVLVLLLGVPKGLGDPLGDEELCLRSGHVEDGPVVAVLEQLQAVLVDVNLCSRSHVERNKIG